MIFMKLKDGVLLHKTGDEYMGITQGDAAQSFNCLILNNETANFIMELLLNDTSEEKIVSDMLERYDVSKEIVQKDVHNIIEKLREENLIDE